MARYLNPKSPTMFFDLSSCRNCVFIVPRLFSSLLSLFVVLEEGCIEAGAGRGQPERLNGEGEVVVLGVVHKEPKQKAYKAKKYAMQSIFSPVVERLLQALGVVALRH